MNIAIVTPWMGVGGAETYVLLKSRWLAERGHAVTVISGGGEWVSRLSRKVRHIEFTVEISPAAFSAVQYEDYLQQLAEIITRSGAEVIETHNTSPAVHIAQSFRYHRTPFLINILNELSYRRNPFLAATTRRCAPLGNLYTVNAQAVKYIEHRLGRKAAWKILRVPVEGIPAGEEHTPGQYVLSVGRMSADKRYLIHAIRGFCAAARSGGLPPAAQLRIVGDGPLRNEIEAEAARANTALGRQAVILLGTLTGEALWREYRGARLFVGSGTSLLLAASAGIPALVVGYTPRSVGSTWGVWGEDPQDVDRFSTTEKQGTCPEAYPQAIIRQWNAPPTGKAREMFTTHYSTGPILEAWEQEYRRAASLDFGTDRFDIRPLIGRYRALWRIYDKIRNR